MDELLVGYLFETLEPEQRDLVEQHLSHDSAWQHRLRQLANALAPLGEDASVEPPPGLALATLARIAEHHCAQRANNARPRCPVPRETAIGRPYSGWRQIDVLAAACVALVCLTLLTPMLAGLWKKNDRLACSNNLRKLWQALATYADFHEGNFPRVEESGPLAFAGVYVPRLGEMGLLQNISIHCPARGDKPAASLRVRDVEQLYHQSPDRYALAVQTLGGHYAYSLGYDDGHGLHHLRRDVGDGVPILADRVVGGTNPLPLDRVANSDNHDGQGQNILFIGGNVRWATHPQVGVAGDHIYLNQQLRQEAGLCRTDSVLGASAVRPYANEP
ncbi:MAG: hypothetical protein SNJ82_05670 [Gemmataceae bacterium]